MRKARLVLTFLIFLTAASISSSEAIIFKDKGLEEGEVIKLSSIIEETELHADSRFTNVWFNGVSGQADRANYAGIIDYRAEFHTPIYNKNDNKGTIVTRVEGLGFFDENIDNFFDDPLIDLPELFVQNTKAYESNDATLVFGKFANRRFLDKDEVGPDPFDIGETPFFGTTANTNTLLNSINERRDDDTFISRQATGSYGFMLGLKDREGSKFTDRWGVKQVFAVSELDHFGNNFYGATEVNKNWGKKYPGQFNLGYLYGQDGVFRIPGDAGNTNMLYTSIIQKVGKFTPYFRYGVADTSVGGTDFAINHFTTGVLFRPTKKDIIATHLAYFDTDPRFGRDRQLVHLNFWIHKWTDHIGSTLFLVPFYGVPNATTFTGEDNNVMIGFNLHASI